MIAIIIPVLNAGKELPVLLNNLIRQACPPDELVVDSGSTDGTHLQNLVASFADECVETAPFRIQEVQTDNGREFTNAPSGQKLLEASRFEIALRDMGISYRRIRIGTPKHNGRVERQHGLDMHRFYHLQRFTSLENARYKLALYNAWSNSRIKVCLNFLSPDQVIANSLAVSFTHH